MCGGRAGRGLNAWNICGVRRKPRTAHAAPTWWFVAGCTNVAAIALPVAATGPEQPENGGGGPLNRFSDVSGTSHAQGGPVAWGVPEHLSAYRGAGRPGRNTAREACAAFRPKLQSCMPLRFFLLAYLSDGLIAEGSFAIVHVYCQCALCMAIEACPWAVATPCNVSRGLRNISCCWCCLCYG